MTTSASASPALPRAGTPTTSVPKTAIAHAAETEAMSVARTAVATARAAGNDMGSAAATAAGRGIGNETATQGQATTAIAIAAENEDGTATASGNGSPTATAAATELQTAAAGVTGKTIASATAPSAGHPPGSEVQSAAAIAGIQGGNILRPRVTTAPRAGYLIEAGRMRGRAAGGESRTNFGGEASGMTPMRTGISSGGGHWGTGKGAKPTLGPSKVAEPSSRLAWNK